MLSNNETKGGRICLSKGPFDRLIAPGKKSFLHHSGIRTCSDLVARRISVLVHTHVKLCRYSTYGLEGIQIYL